MMPVSSDLALAEPAGSTTTTRTNLGTQTLTC